MLSGLKGFANYISFILLIPIFIICILNQNKVIKFNKAMVCAFIFLLYYALTSLLHFNIYFFSIEYAYYILAFSPLVISFVVKENNSSFAALDLLQTTMFLWIIMCVYSIILYRSSPNFARAAAADQNLALGMIFGGYQYTYASAILAVYVYSVYLRCKSFISHRERFILIVFEILLLVEIYLTESSITTLSVVIGIIATYFLNQRNNESKKRTFKFAIFIIVLVAFMLIVENNINYIYLWLISHSDTRIFYRLKEIVQAVFFDSTTSHYERRSQTLIDSITTFIKSPIFGVGYKYGNVTSIGKAKYGIGNHSELLDAFAQFGMLGAIPFISIYVISMKEYLRRYTGILITFIIMVLFNPFFYFLTCLTVFMIIPLSEYVINNRIINLEI